MPSYTNSKKVAPAKMHCQHCKNLGNAFDTHNKDTCPVLQALKCHYCGAKGHSQKYCDARKFDEEQAARLHHYREKEKRRINFEQSLGQKIQSATKISTKSSAFAALGEEDSSSESEAETIAVVIKKLEPALVLAPPGPATAPAPVPAWEVELRSPASLSDDYTDTDDDELPSMFDFRPLKPSKPEVGSQKPRTPVKSKKPTNWADVFSDEDD